MKKDKSVKFVPAGSTALEEKFINYLMLDGKKSIARKIFADTLAIISKKVSNDPEKIFELAVNNIKPSMEIKPKRVGGAVYQVPHEVKTNRQVALAFRWILAATRGKKGSSMAQRLANELIDASNETGAAVKKKEDTHRMAQANKAFAHFARY